MTPSSPSPSRSLHEYGNSESDQDKGPECTEQMEVEPAKLVQQKNHAQADENHSSHRHARCFVVLLRLHRLSFHRSHGSHRGRGISRRCRLARASEKVHCIEAEWVGRANAHL